MQIKKSYLKQIIKEEINEALKESMHYEEIEKIIKKKKNLNMKFRCIRLDNMWNNVTLHPGEVIQIYKIDKNFKFVDNDDSKMKDSKVHTLIYMLIDGKQKKTTILPEIIWALQLGLIVPADLPLLSQCPILKKEIWDQEDKAVALDWLESVGYFHYSDYMRQLLSSYQPSELRNHLKSNVVA